MYLGTRIRLASSLLRKQTTEGLKKLPRSGAAVLPSVLEPGAEGD